MSRYDPQNLTDEQARDATLDAIAMVEQKPLTFLREKALGR